MVYHHTQGAVRHTNIPVTKFYFKSTASGFIVYTFHVSNINYINSQFWGGCIRATPYFLAISKSISKFDGSRERE